MRRTYALASLVAIMLVLMLAACGKAGTSQASSAETSPQAAYQQISQDEAMRMMGEDDSLVVVDVRTPEEYESGHIAGAINVPNEEIGSEQPSQLPDLDQVILVYCRSGRRSKEAAAKLAAMGYAKVYEFGGINTWPGDIVT